MCFMFSRYITWHCVKMNAIREVQFDQMCLIVSKSLALVIVLQLCELCIASVFNKKLLNMALKGKRVSIDTSPKYINPVVQESRNIQKFPNGLNAMDTREPQLLRRSSMICSEGFDKYTFDCHRDDIPHRSVGLELDGELAMHNFSDVSSMSDRASIRSDMGGASLIKRDSVVHPGKFDVQHSVCVNGRFQNPWPTWHPPTVTNILKFGLSKNRSNVAAKNDLNLVLPIVKPDFVKYSKPPEDGIRITWIGHSTVLIQMHGLNVLTDPIFSDRASPSQMVGPKRYRPPPCSIHDLPHIDAVVISHSHYDHLDFNTVQLLNARFDTDIRWFVPLGLLSWMHQIGCENVVELDWWEENCVPEHSNVNFVFTPAQHWSKRTISDDYKVLWGSWCIIGPKYRFFFAGDTGYCDVFRQIGRVYGPFDIAAIPIGAYEPRWFMKFQHINPEEAVKVHMDVKSRNSLAIHWGTFSLANEYYLDPPLKLRESLEEQQISPKCFFTLKHGETRLITQDYPVQEKRKFP